MAVQRAECRQGDAVVVIDWPDQPPASSPGGKRSQSVRLCQLTRRARPHARRLDGGRIPEAHEHFRAQVAGDFQHLDHRGLAEGRDHACAKAERMGGQEHRLRGGADVDVKPLRGRPHAEAGGPTMVDTDHHHRRGALEHPGRHHAQHAQRQRVLYDDKAVQVAIARVGRPAGRFQDLFELGAADGPVDHGPHHAPAPDRGENGIGRRRRCVGPGHGTLRSRPKWTTRCSPTARHRSSTAVAYPAGSAVRTASSGI